MNSNSILGTLSSYFNVSSHDVVERIIWSAVPMVFKAHEIDQNEDNRDCGTNESQLSGDAKDISGYSSQSTVLLFDESFEKSDPFVIPLLSQPKATKSRVSYIEKYIQMRPDFYGPFWICITLICLTAIFSNPSGQQINAPTSDDTKVFTQFSNMHDSKFSPDSPRMKGGSHIFKSKSDRHRLISRPTSVSEEDKAGSRWQNDLCRTSFVASCILAYVTIVPTILWFYCLFRGCSFYYTLTETVCAYSYSLSFLIPISPFILLIKANFIKMVAVSFGTTMSGAVLVISFLPVVKSDPSRSVQSCSITLLMISLAHILMAISFIVATTDSY